MTDGPLPQASLFWDESAFPNASMSGYEVVKAIRAFTAKIGAIKSLRFYVDIASNKVLSPELRSELQCSGVSVIDTVSRGRQCTASKMLLTDLFTSARDNVGIFSVMIIISADPDLGYPISTLRVRGERVVLLCPATVDPQFLDSVDGIIFEGDALETSMPTTNLMQPKVKAPLATSPQAVPPHFQVMIDFLNNARSSKGIMVYERGFLHRHLLEMRQTIFEEAGISNFVNPMAEYIDRAATLGIVRASKNHGVQLMPAFRAAAPSTAAEECPSGKAGEGTASEAMFSRQDEKAPSSTLQTGFKYSGADQVSEPTCRPDGSPDALAEDDELAPIANELQSPYLLCVEAVEALPDFTGLVGPAFFPDSSGITPGAMSLPRIREKIKLGVYDENPQLFYADMVSIFNIAQTSYRQSADTLEDAQEVGKASEAACHSHIAAVNDGEGGATAHDRQPSNNQQEWSASSESFGVVHARDCRLGLDGDIYTILHAPQASAPIPMTFWHQADLDALAPPTSAVWSTADLPWPIPSRFHALVQFLNEERVNRGIGYSWGLLKTPILMRHPLLLKDHIEAAGCKRNTWNVYLTSAVELGIVEKMKNPRRVCLTAPFRLDLSRSTSPLQVPTFTSRRTNSENMVTTSLPHSPSGSQQASNGTNEPIIAHARSRSVGMDEEDVCTTPCLHLPRPASAAPVLTTHLPNLASASSGHALWSTTDLPWPIPTHFHVLVQFLNEEKAIHGIDIHSWYLLKIPILRRCPLLLEGNIGAVGGMKNTWDLYLRSAVDLGILTEIKNPSRVSLAQPFMLDWRRLPASTPATVSTNPGPPDPVTQVATVCEAASSPSLIHIPPYFHVLIEYLQEEMAAGRVIHRRNQLRVPLLSRQPNLLTDAKLPRTSRCRESSIIHYLQAAADLRIIGMNAVTKPATLWLSPEYHTWGHSDTAEPVLEPNPAESSAFPGIPAYFDALIYYLRARRSAGLFLVPRQALCEYLLRRQPDVFLQAGTAQFKNPIHDYIGEAETLGIIVKEDRYVSLHPTYC